MIDRGLLDTTKLIGFWLRGHVQCGDDVLHLQSPPRFFGWEGRACNVIERLHVFNPLAISSGLICRPGDIL